MIDGVVFSDKFIKQIAEEISPTVRQAKQLERDELHCWRSAVKNGEWC